MTLDLRSTTGNRPTGAQLTSYAGSGVVDIDAARYTARCEAAGFTMSAAQFTATNKLFKRIKEAGIYGKIDDFWMPVFGSLAGILGGKGRSNLTVSGTVTFTAGFGARGNGTDGYLDTGINPTTFTGTNWELNAAAVGAFCNDPAVRTANRLISISGGNLRVTARNASDFTAGYINDATGTDAVSASTTRAPALLSLVRLGSADKRIFNNRRQTASFSTASTSISNGNVIFLRDGANYGTEQISFGYVAYALRPAEVLALSDAVTEFLQAIISPVLWFGDSLTYGQDAAGSGQMALPPPTQLQTLLGRLVYNGGISGETSSQIRVRVTADDFGAQGVEVYWAGKNNVSAPSTVASDAALMAAWNQTGKYIMVGVTPTGGSDAAPGDTNYANRMTINTGLSSTYGSRYYDPLPDLQAANDGSANDLADVAAGLIPRSLRWAGNATHTSDTVNGAGYNGAGVVAAGIRTKMVALGY